MYEEQHSTKRKDQEWRWQSDEIPRKQPKTERKKQRDHTKQLLRAGRYDELYEDE